MSVALGPKVVTDGLVFLFDAGNHMSYPGTGTSATDIVTKSVGTMANITISNGRLNFNGTTSEIDFGVLQESLVDNFEGGGTVLVFFRAESDGEGNFGRVADTQQSDTTTGWAVHTREEASSALQIAFQIGASANANVWKTTNTFSINEWMMYTATWDSDSANTAPLMYVNAVSESVTTLQAAGTSYNSNSGNDLFIGNRSNSDRTFDGDIEYVSLYNRVLTPSEIIQNYNALKGRFGL